MVRVQLLDEIVVVDADGERCRVGGPRSRALIARLALERGRSLSLDVLEEELWGRDSSEMRTTLRAYMSRLRSTALGPWLSGGRSGYRLMEGPDLFVDLWTVEDAGARRSSPDQHTLSELLATWRDAPLQGIGEPPFADAARARIRRVVDTVRLQIARDDLDAGRIDRALLTLRTLQMAHPEDGDLLALVRVAQGRAATADRAFLRIAGATENPPQSTGPTDLRHIEPASMSPAAPAMGQRRGIPAPIARIVGRQDERASLTAALDVSRLVTITGAAGVGKTRLAVDWLSSEAAAGEDNVWFVSIGDREGERVSQAVAAAVGAADASPAGIAAHLANRRGILVIDGAETAAAEVARLAIAVLSDARALAILSTSRRTLGVPGESVLRVDPLPVDDARALFAARLVSTSLPTIDSEMLGGLLEKLGRLPLAIELAAARAALMPVEEVAESMLRNVARPSPEDDAPLASALRSSLDLLTEDQRETMRSVAGFAGAFTREAASAVCGERPRDTDLDCLAAFSLISPENSGAAPTFRMSELMRRAVRDGEAPQDDWARRHREWFASRADQSSVALTVEGSLAAIARIRDEWPDMLAAFDSAVLTGDRQTAASIAGGLLWYGVRTGCQRDLLDLNRRAFAVPGAADATHEAQLCLTRGFLAYQLGSMGEAATWIAAAREPSERSEDPGLRATARAFAAYLGTLGSPTSTDSESQLAVALADLDDLPDPAAAMVLLIGGQVHRASGRATQAIALIDRAAALANRCGHEWVALMAPVVAAKVYLDLRRGAPAAAELLPVVRRSAATGDPVSLLIAASVAAGAAATLGEDMTGARIIGAVDAIGRRYGFDPRANEPADFELYLRRVRQGLTLEEWRSAYAHGVQSEVRDLVDLAASLVPRR